MIEKLSIIAGVMLGLCTCLTILLIGNDVTEEESNLLAPTIIKKLL